MARERSLLGQLAREWADRTALTDGRADVVRWHRLTGCFGGYGSVGEVMASLEDRTDKARSARLLNGLLVAAADDTAARDALMHALIPGLCRTANGLLRRMRALQGSVDLPWSSRAELEADVVAECLHQIDQAAGRPLAHPAAQLLSRTRTRLWRAVYRSQQSPQLELDLDRHIARDTRPAWRELEDLLRDAVDDGTIDRGDAELIWRYRVGDERIGVTAQARSASWAKIQKRRERAERRLVACLTLEQEA